MIYVLFATLFLIVVANYLFRRNILLPSFIMSVSFFVTSFIYVMCSKTITDDIGLVTVLVILASIIVFSLGEWACELFFKRRRSKCRFSFVRRQPSAFYSPSINCFWVLLFSALILIAAYTRVIALCEMSSIDKTIPSFFLSYSKIRFLLTHETSPVLPFWVGLVSTIASALVKICITLFSWHLIQNKKICWRYVLLVFSYICFAITTTSRTVYLDLAAYAFVQFVFLRWFLFGKKPVLSKGLVAVLFSLAFFFLIAFFFIGEIANKNESFGKTLFGYSAAAFVGLDRFLAEPFYAESLLHSRTLEGLFSPFARLGFSIPKLDPFLPHYSYLNGLETSNEYTSIMEPIHDFGIFGMLLTRLLLGAVYYAIYRLILSSRKSGSSAILLPVFGVLYYPLVISSIDDQFSTYIGMSYIYHILISIVIWMVIVKKRDLRKGIYDRKQTRPQIISVS